MSKHTSTRLSILRAIQDNYSVFFGIVYRAILHDPMVDDPHATTFTIINNYVTETPQKPEQSIYQELLISAYHMFEGHPHNYSVITSMIERRNEYAAVKKPAKQKKRKRTKNSSREPRNSSSIDSSHTPTTLELSRTNRRAFSLSHHRYM